MTNEPVLAAEKRIIISEFIILKLVIMATNVWVFLYPLKISRVTIYGVSFFPNVPPASSVPAEHGAFVWEKMKKWTYICLQKIQIKHNLICRKTTNSIRKYRLSL